MYRRSAPGQTIDNAVYNLITKKNIFEKKTHQDLSWITKHFSSGEQGGGGGQGEPNIFHLYIVNFVCQMILVYFNRK